MKKKSIKMINLIYVIIIFIAIIAMVKYFSKENKSIFSISSERTNAYAQETADNVSMKPVIPNRIRRC